MSSSASLPELALTDHEIDEILRACNGQALLVGGQSLAFWAQYYKLAPPAELSRQITRDADFLGAASVARQLFAALKSQGWRYWQPSADDATAQTAKLSKRVEGLGIKQIDFLGSIVGLKTEAIRRRAVTLPLDRNTRLQILHPLDVLESRLKNLAQLPSKRNAEGVAQAQLALDVVHSFLTEWLGSREQREGLAAVERVADIALDKQLRGVYHDLGLQPLRCVPVDLVPSDPFRRQRWPQIQQAFTVQQEKYAAQRQRTVRRRGPRNQLLR